MNKCIFVISIICTNSTNLLLEYLSRGIPPNSIAMVIIILSLYVSPSHNVNAVHIYQAFIYSSYFSYTVRFKRAAREVLDYYFLNIGVIYLYCICINIIKLNKR